MCGIAGTLGARRRRAPADRSTRPSRPERHSHRARSGAFACPCAPLDHRSRRRLATALGRRLHHYRQWRDLQLRRTRPRFRPAKHAQNRLRLRAALAHLRARRRARIRSPARHVRILSDRRRWPHLARARSVRHQAALLKAQDGVSLSLPSRAALAAPTQPRIVMREVAQPQLCAEPGHRLARRDAPGARRRSRIQPWRRCAHMRREAPSRRQRPRSRTKRRRSMRSTACWKTACASTNAPTCPMASFSRAASTARLSPR